MEKNPTKEKYEYRRLKKAVARAMKEEAVRKISELGRNPNNVFRHVRKMKRESTDVVGGRYMRGNEMKHIDLMRRIEQNSGNVICLK